MMQFLTNIGGFFLFNFVIVFLDNAFSIQYPLLVG